MTLSSLWLTLAGALCVLLAAIHSGLGERFIFRPWRETPLLPGFYAGIIRASWHALSLFGLVIAIVLWRVPLDGITALAICCGVLASAALIALWTRFRHPGWIVLTLIAGLVLLSRL